MPEKERQRLVDQEATNAQTVQFVADQEATIAEQADALAKEQPEWTPLADRERANRERLEAVAEQQRRLATQIQLGDQDPTMIAALAREHRKELMEVAREEGQILDLIRRQAEQDPTVVVLAEQAQRNQELLFHVAGMETETDRTLRAAQSRGDSGEDAGGECPDDDCLGASMAGAELAASQGIGFPMALVEAAQHLADERTPER